MPQLNEFSWLYSSLKLVFLLLSILLVFNFLRFSSSTKALALDYLYFQNFN